MVRVGHGKPGPYRHSDRWGRPVNRWSVNDWCWVTEEQLEKYGEYQRPLPKGISLEAAEALVRKKLEWCKSTLWQFDLDTRDGDRVRFVIAMGLDDGAEDKMMRWSWADCWLRRPFWLVHTYFKNRFTKPCEYESE